MKNRYLLTHILTHIQTLVRLYDRTFTLLETASGDPDFSDAPYGEMIMRHPLLRSHDFTGRLPLLFSVNGTLAYAWVGLENEFCLLGPVHLTEKIEFRNSLRFSVEGEDGVPPWENTIPYCSINVFAEDILLLYHLESPMPKGDASFLNVQRLVEANSTYHHIQHQILKEFYQTVFENVENRFAHNPYNHEVRECACIRRGDVDGLRRVLTDRFPGRYGKLAENPVRQAINLGIVSVTLASRAAIEGGLHYETSFYLSDIFIQQLDACRDAAAAEHLYRNAQFQYAELVHELLVKKTGNMPEMENRHISRCKDYIFAHLHEKMTVQQIAKAVGLDANYLSALFRRCEKVPLKQFILYEKVKLARNLLAYSDLTYAQIATSLGFSSQSHMGVEFRKVTGMTPRAYRLANSADDFVHESMARSREE